jgi:hypothetical protein
MSMFSFAGGYVPVTDLSVTTAWYKQALDCFCSESTDDEGQPAVTLQFYRKDPGFMLCTSASHNDLPPIIYTGNAAKAHEFLVGRGVTTTSVQQDEQGTKHFEITDCDGNLLEISEEP